MHHTWRSENKNSFHILIHSLFLLWAFLFSGLILCTSRYMDSASICLPRVHWLFLVDYKTRISANLDKHFLFSFGFFEDEKMERGPWDTHRVDSMGIWSYLISRRSYQTVWPYEYFARNYRDGRSGRPVRPFHTKSYVSGLTNLDALHWIMKECFQLGMS